MSDDYLNKKMAEMIRLREQMLQERERKIKAAPPTVPPLTEQITAHLRNLPPAQRERISIPALLPHLRGKWREHPHLLHVARALRQLGFTHTRTWNQTDGHGHRYWLAPTTTN